MATTRSSEDIVDSTPLLANSGGSTDDLTSGRRFARRQRLRQAVRFLQQASGRRMMREPSMLVREAAAEQLEERQGDWAYSKPVVVLDIVWNLAFVIVAGTVLVLSVSEAPGMPLRLWIVGYALQCFLHMVCVCVEYRRRRRHQRAASLNSVSAQDRVGDSSGNLSVSSREGSASGSAQYVSLGQFDEEGTSVAKHLESANTMFSFVWWIIGFYWVSAGGQALAQESPQLYWLCIIFLGFDVFFVVFCVALACIIGIAVCCCLPCIIALLYAVADQEGASKEDIEQLSKFKFRRIESNEKLNGTIQGPVGGIMTECQADSPIEHVLAEEDAECCICLSSYDNGVELRELPCGHHFHCACVDKWLYINATCPLCKYNILKSSNLSQEEV
ncbi:E3 ubiquitin-protein ligase At1g12760 isoform X2 [Cajanus cajan]|uniref:RING-type E3 ubiquitin transferase n=1 Tax=Cajanus cajan TaxID=3821 RepID=A0A151TJP1_CAJCA|nr:E3 ubiquitin-protein ligase At1g12760 isoform X2 [Cajanus cajan]KYP67260.1 E3 ubiquitin-protein ligase At1g12760 family [Cajanus cajan]